MASTAAEVTAHEPGRAAGLLTGWGRFPRVPGSEASSERLDHVTRDVPLTRGLGRAYGDAALPASGDLRVAGSVRASRLLAFDESTGDLTAEAGFTLDELIRVFLPRGFFTPVSPGTRFVTLGGMVAADVHGKNHHRAGTIGRHLQSLKIRVADGSVVTCSRVSHPDLFPRDDRWNGSHRSHPRGVAPAGTGAFAVDPVGNRANAAPRGVHRRAQAIQPRVADDRWLDRLPLTAAGDGPRHPIPRPVG